MQSSPALPLPLTGAVPNPPGMTPPTVHPRVATTGTVLGAGTFNRPATVGAGSSTAPAVQHQVLEVLEDAVLLLLFVFAVPIIIMLLALPIALIFRIAVGIGQRW